MKIVLFLFFSFCCLHASDKIIFKLNGKEWTENGQVITNWNKVNQVNEVEIIAEKVTKMKELQSVFAYCAKHLPKKITYSCGDTSLAFEKPSNEVGFLKMKEDHQDFMPMLAVYNEKSGRITDLVVRVFRDGMTEEEEKRYADKTFDTPLTNHKNIKSQFKISSEDYKIKKFVGYVVATKQTTFGNLIELLGVLQKHSTKYVLAASNDKLVNEYISPEVKVYKPILRLD